MLPYVTGNQVKNYIQQNANAFGGGAYKVLGDYKVIRVKESSSGEGSEGESWKYVFDGATPDVDKIKEIVAKNQLPVLHINISWIEDGDEEKGSLYEHQMNAFAPYLYSVREIERLDEEILYEDAGFIFANMGLLIEYIKSTESGQLIDEGWYIDVGF